jgi:3-methyladenine DNA glycosylase AlkD
MPVHALVAAVRDGLAAAADPAKAPGMQSYMKSAMPYRGVPAPVQERLFKQIFAVHRLPTRDAWLRAARELWRKAQYREERYAAVALTGHAQYREHQRPDVLPLYEEMIVTGAWWDYVDAVAIHRVGPLVLAHPDEIKPVVRSWSRDADMWRRRTSIICQCAAKSRTDLSLLYECIAPNLDDREFFIRKAIGWALRSYAWIDPDEVERYAATVGLSPLSRREALKNVEKIKSRRTRATTPS